MVIGITVGGRSDGESGPHELAGYVTPAALERCPDPIRLSVAVILLLQLLPERLLCAPTGSMSR
jgi:hypothetical protein